MQPLKKVDIPVTPLYKPGNPVTVPVISNDPLTDPATGEEVRHIVFDLSNTDFAYSEGQSLGVIPEGVDEKGKPHRVRLYSIASAAEGETKSNGGKDVALTVRRLVYEDEHGNNVYGLCSNYLCDLKVGDSVKITGPNGKRFLCPDDPDTDIIMFATGTGIAPFRSFFLSKKFNAIAAKNILFFGVRRQSDMLYGNEFNNDITALADSDKISLFPALSREIPGKKVYVQDILLEQRQRIEEIIRKGNYAIYICGLLGMEKGIEENLISIFSDADKNFEEEKKLLRETGRWNLEVY